MKKLNCWESKKCGREPGGFNAGHLGICPAAEETCLNGTHGGWNGGRACWIVAGSLCGGKIQGTFAMKFDSCSACDFYQAVRKEEGGGFQYAAILIRRVKDSESLRPVSV